MELIWACYAKNSIDNYSNNVLDYIDEGLYEIAGLELGTSISQLEACITNMPPASISAYLLGLVARFKLLQQYCLEERADPSTRRYNIATAIDRIDERLHIVELSTASLMEI